MEKVLQREQENPTSNGGEMINDFRLWGSRVSRSVSAMACRRTAASGVACFRDWAAEETDHPREVIEAALGHLVRNRVEAT